MRENGIHREVREQREKNNKRRDTMPECEWQWAQFGFSWVSWP